MTEINFVVIFSGLSQLVLLVVCGCLPGFIHAGFNKLRANKSNRDEG